MELKSLESFRMTTWIVPHRPPGYAFEMATFEEIYAAVTKTGLGKVAMINYATLAVNIAAAKAKIDPKEYEAEVLLGIRSSDEIRTEIMNILSGQMLKDLEAKDKPKGSVLGG